MYFCEDHGSVSDDGAVTVRSYRGRDAGLAAQPASSPSPPQSPPPEINGEVSTAGGSAAAAANSPASPPITSQPVPLGRLVDANGSAEDLAAYGATASVNNGGQGGGGGSGGSSSSDSAGSSNNGRQLSDRDALDEPSNEREDQRAARTLPLPINGLHRIGDGGSGGSAGTAYLLQAAAAAAAAATAGCGFQEVREISLGRHNDEPYGMKVEAVGEAFFITHVVRNSVAACAGLKIGDEIVRINERRLEGLRTREVLQAIRQSELCVKLAYKPRAVVARIREVRLKKDNGLLGLRLLKKPDGLYIDFVKRGTSAYEAGLKDGDQVLKINSHIVTDWSMEGAMALLKSLSDTEQLVLLVRETLPIANLAGTGPTPLALATANRHKNQPQAVSKTAEPAEQPHGQDGQDNALEAEQITDSAGAEAATATASKVVSTEEKRRLKVPGSNPCTSTDDLEITRLPDPAETPGASKAAAAAAATTAAGSAAASGNSGGFSASTFFKSFHAPNRLTNFLKSSRLSKHQQQQQSDFPPAPLPAAGASTSKD